MSYYLKFSDCDEEKVLNDNTSALTRIPKMAYIAFIDGIVINPNAVRIYVRLA